MAESTVRIFDIMACNVYWDFDGSPLPREQHKFLVSFYPTKGAPTPELIDSIVAYGPDGYRVEFANQRFTPDNKNGYIYDRTLDYYWYMVNLATVILYHKKLYVSDWAGTIIMLFGVLLVLGVDFGGMTLHVTDLYFLLSAACVSANAFIIKSAQEKYHEDADMISYYNNAVVLILFAGSAAFAGDFHLPANLPGGFWPLVVLGGLAQTGIYFFYYRNLKHFEVWLVKLYLLLMPVLSCFIGVFFLNEELSTKKLLGILIVLAGAAVILQRGRINHHKLMNQ